MMYRKIFWPSSFLVLSLAAFPGCGTDDADAGSNGAGVCTIVDLGDGTSAIRCPDGTELVVSNGKDGKDGKDGDKGDGVDCTLGKSADGKDTLTCGGQTVTIGDPCEDGYYGDVNLYERDQSGSKSFTLFQVTNCTWIRGDLDIDEFDGETLPSALSRLEKVDGYVYIGWTEALTTVSFPALTTIGDDLDIRYNDALTAVSFPALTRIGEELDVSDNDALINLDGFPALKSVGRWLYIYENASLERVSNFQALTSVGGIDVSDNQALESMAAFPALQEITGFGDGPNPGYSLFFIKDNPVLSSIGKLGKVTSIDGSITVENNPELEQADVDALFEDIAISGSTRFCGNKDSGPC